MKADLSKEVKRTLRELCSQAYEAEMRQSLQDLSREFDRWKGGEIDSFELSNLIHEYHQGPNRKLYSQYQGNALIELNVASAIHRGLISCEGLDQEVLEVLERQLVFLESTDRDE